MRKYWYNQIVLQPCTACNINCNYCYLKGRNRQTLMSKEVANILAMQLAEDVTTKPRKIELIWHGSEPLTTGIQHFTDLLSSFDNLFAKGYIRHSIQTNAILINEEWCKLFSKYKFNIGVSIDGTEEMNQNRVDWAGKTTFKKTLNGIKKLKEYNIPFDIIAVVSKSGIHKAKEFYNFFKNLGLRHLNINIEEKEGVNQNPSFIDYEDAKEFWAELFIEWQQNSNFIRVREFDKVIRWLGTVTNNNKKIEQHTKVNIWPTIATNGDICVLSPELITFDTKFIIGNILNSTLMSYIEQCNTIWYLRDYENGRKKCSETCDYYSFCGGGYASNKYHENNTMNSAETTYCKNARKALIDGVLPIVLKSK